MPNRLYGFFIFFLSSKLMWMVRDDAQNC